jgi:hypothetical protein
MGEQRVPDPDGDLRIVDDASLSAAAEALGRGPDQPLDLTGDRPRLIVPPLATVLKARPANHGSEEDEWVETYPTICSYLFKGSWDDIQPRDPGSLSIRAVNGVVTITLSCPTEGKKCPMHGVTICQVLEAMERACRDGTARWVDLDYGTGKQRLKSERRKLLDAEAAKRDHHD